MPVFDPIANNGANIMLIDLIEKESELRFKSRDKLGKPRVGPRTAMSLTRFSPGGDILNDEDISMLPSRLPSPPKFCYYAGGPIAISWPGPGGLKRSNSTSSSQPNSQSSGSRHEGHTKSKGSRRSRSSIAASSVLGGRSSCSNKSLRCSEQREAGLPLSREERLRGILAHANGWRVD
mmetsp:Transcript_96566/g.211156  ORF Transcript_96566/g.211156 Transcript_96566/m.211156 type:complete len:178 (-) Transcript_96566:291-824(-)|eukprot:CAMPEP_0206605832 /NCGR_PEP_ID=MMETSP0325_2-20121206/50729_1 /ASSEMBLY_ACC=CAM_ASM_000347 /TAXON_ID=2866 /ORGANISM="Crypthecodinium cohnii, Strain Seligo" /LENGTH=177 /DNA_ID=CAMNT_0054121609 /DNA_START=67 /DNA_END=600 /DNA_ORIENTATION=+